MEYLRRCIDVGEDEIDISAYTKNHQFRILSLSIIATCRHLYEEEAHVLWFPNIFVFTQGSTFNDFLRSLTTDQKRKMLHIHLEITVSMLYNTDDMTTALKRWGLIRSSSNNVIALRSLKICMSLSMSLRDKNSVDGSIRIERNPKGGF